MRVLHIGGTGLISSVCVEADVLAGREVFVLNRGITDKVPLPNDVRRLIADASDPGSLQRGIGALVFDSVIQWTAFTPDRVRDDVSTFRQHGQYVFISSASAYQKPPEGWLIRESSTPLGNPHWEYSRNKIACERVLRDEFEESSFPMTIVRPSLTYGLTQIPVCIGSWDHPFTIIDRMRRKSPILVPGDGTAIWTITHNTDFAKGLVGLEGNPSAIGEDFHITSDEALSWNQIYRLVGAAAGVTPNILHVPSDALVAADPDLEGTLWGDKIHSTVFDNSKLKTLVPDFRPAVKFRDGIVETVRWFDQNPSRRTIDNEANHLWDHIASVYVKALLEVASLQQP